MFLCISIRPRLRQLEVPGGGLMVEFINQLTGTVMYVAEERAAEYAAAGHKQVARDPPAAAAAEKPKAARKAKAK